MRPCIQDHVRNLARSFAVSGGHEARWIGMGPIFEERTVPSDMVGRRGTRGPGPLAKILATCILVGKQPGAPTMQVIKLRLLRNECSVWWPQKPACPFEQPSVHAC